MNYPGSSLAVLPMKNAIIFPGTVQTIRVGRELSKKAVDWSVQNAGSWILAVAQKNPEKMLESEKDLHSIGTVVRIESINRSSDSSYLMTVRGYHRSRWFDCDFSKGFYHVQWERMDDLNDLDRATYGAYLTSVKSLSIEILNLLPGDAENLIEIVRTADDLAILGHLAIVQLESPLAEKQTVLEEINLKHRTSKILQILQDFKQSLIIQNDIRSKLNAKLGQTQREHILREQLKTIKHELGDDESIDVDDDYRKKLEKANLPESAKKLAEQQIRRLSQSSNQSPEYQMIRSHLDLMLSLPWDKSSEIKDLNLDQAEQILNSDHYGLDKIKKRLLQHLAVSKRRKNGKGTILLLVGPPGVGKTSLGQSMAKALGKKFYRLSLGGLRDESEIKGHRRTYIGALPGKFISAMNKIGENDPVILLDEIDKLSRSFAGDPASALLEVLDPEQNSHFSDYYLDVPFDLSKAFFVATANSLDTIPLPLLDRMEIVELTGYTLPEKINIAKNHIVPKICDEYSLSADELAISDATLSAIISQYTREAGVRDLQRKIHELARLASINSEKGKSSLNFSVEFLEDYLGTERFPKIENEKKLSIGTVTGLAWTPVGGDVLYIETAVTPGKGDLVITGQLGEVMRESAQIARTLVKARLPFLAPRMDLNKLDIHLHVPSGGIPKDGPSAGITILTSLASLLSRKEVDARMAMTGEISLRGKVLPVGGIKEKVIAAHRAGIKKIILSVQNRKDIKEIPDDIKPELNFIFVEHINQVLCESLGIDLGAWTDDIFFTNEKEKVSTKVTE